jgi:hypothetical protein
MHRPYLQYLSIVVALAGGIPAFGQLHFAENSPLADSAYVVTRIKTISNADLFGSLRLQGREFSVLCKSLEKGDTLNAYREWSKYWRGKKQPRYVTRSVGYLLDTEMLTDYEGLRGAARTRPGELDTTLAMSSELLRNRIRTWGMNEVDFGRRVDFNRELGRSGKYGFHYWWWARPLISAFLLKNDPRYVAKFDEFFTRWYEQRNSITRTIPDLDVVYYELGLSARARVFVEQYLLPIERRDPLFHEMMLKTLLATGRWLYALEDKEGYRPGNWQIHGAYTLLQLGLTFPEMAEASAWLEMGVRRLKEHLLQDFSDDGGHSERAPRNYTFATYLVYRNALYLLTGHAKEKEFAAQVKGSMGKTLEWLITMVTPTGDVPAINDSHRGRIPVEVMEDGAALFDRPEVNAVLKSLLRVSQPRGKGGALPSFTSRNMPASGFAVMRSDWTREALYLNINYGPYAGSHTHFDLLSFELYAYGAPLAVDAGIGATYDDPLHESWYRSSRAHNMVVVNGRNIDRDSARGEDVRWATTESVEYFAASHSGYASLGIHHRRAILFVKPDYWVIADDLEGAQPTDTLSWYLHTPSRILPYRGGFQSTESPGLTILPAQSGLRTGIGQGWAASVSDPLPGRTQLIPWVRFDQMGKKDSVTRFTMLLSPFRTGVVRSTVQGFSDGRMVVTTPAHSDEIRFGSCSDSSGALQTDGAALWMRKRPGRIRFAVIDGTYLRYGGKEIWRSETRTSYEGEFKQ